MRSPFLLLALLLLGCGDISGVDGLFSPNGGGDSGGAHGGASATSSQQGTGGMAASSGVVTSVAATSSVVSSAAVTSSSQASSAQATTVATTASVASSAMASTGSGTTNTLPCGDDECPQGGPNACCSYVFTQGGGPSFVCIQGDGGCDTDATPGGFRTRIECHDGSQCGFGQKCCGDRRISMSGAPTYYDRVSCESSCDWPTGVTLCDPNSGDLLQCPVVSDGGNLQQTHCQPSQLLPDGYYVCSP